MKVHFAFYLNVKLPEEKRRGLSEVFTVSDEQRLYKDGRSFRDDTCGFLKKLNCSQLPSFASLRLEKTKSGQRCGAASGTVRAVADD